MPKGRNKGGNKRHQGGKSPKKTPHKTPPKTSPSHNNTPVLPKNASLKEKGNFEFQKGNYQNAIKLYTTDIETNKENSEIHTLYSNRSAAYLHCKKYEMALQDAEKCITLKPEWAKGYVRKSMVLVEMKKVDDAEKVLNDAMNVCVEKEPIKKEKNKIDILRINSLDRNDKIVGGHHLQTGKFRKLINWLIEGGAKFPKLYIKFYTTEYRAIHAISDIKKDEDICFIPHDKIMTSDVAKASIIGQQIINGNIELRSKHSYLACYLLQEKEKGINSAWHIYIDILPEKFITIPLFFNKEQLAELEGSIAIKKINDRIESLQLEYESLSTVIPDFKQRFTLKEFIWARLVVITRIFGLVIDSIKTDGLVPMADMLNHMRPRQTKWTYAQKKKGFLITSLTNIRRNSEIFDSYGRKCNSRFFVNYGFSLEFNLDNEALMSFELPKNDPHYNIKARFLSQSGVSRDFQISRLYKEKKVKECFSYLRILHAQGNEFLIISTTNGIRLEDIPPLSIKNEINVLTTLAVSATRSLKKFQTTLDYDNKLLDDEEKYPKYSNQRNIVLMRRGEKEVLTYYINLRKICSDLLKLKFKDLKIRLKKDKQFKDPDSIIMQYINYVVIPLVQRQQ